MYSQCVAHLFYMRDQTLFLTLRKDHSYKLQVFENMFRKIYRTFFSEIWYCESVQNVVRQISFLVSICPL